MTQVELTKTIESEATRFMCENFHYTERSEALEIVIRNAMMKGANIALEANNARIRQELAALVEKSARRS